MKTEEEIKAAIKKVDDLADEFGRIWGQGWPNEMLAFRRGLEWTLKTRKDDLVIQ